MSRDFRLSFFATTLIFKHISILFLFLLFSIPLVAEDRDIAKLFSQEKIEGTMVIVSLYSGQRFKHNDLRANKRFTTASTFNYYQGAQKVASVLAFAVLSVCITQSLKLVT